MTEALLPEEPSRFAEVALPAQESEQLQQLAGMD
jgi:hypothetical protein